MEDKKQNLEITESGLQCDNPNCDWVDATIKFADHEQWLNKPCPKCGENVLTEEDHLRSKLLFDMAAFINSMTEDELDAFNKSIGAGTLADFKEHPVFGKIEGVQELKDEGEAIMTISSHEKITIDKIKNV